eukprot:15456455-Alexandrium_andersonii.AAC.1
MPGARPSHPNDPTGRSDARAIKIRGRLPGEAVEVPAEQLAHLGGRRAGRHDWVGSAADDDAPNGHR